MSPSTSGPTFDPTARSGRDLTHYPAGFRANVGGGYSPDGQWIVFRLEGPGLVPTMYRIRPDGTDLHALYEVLHDRPQVHRLGGRPRSQVRA